MRHTVSFSPSLCHPYSRRCVAPFLDTAAVLDFQTAKPNQLHASFAPRINFAQVFFKNHMYIMGGMKEDREVTNDMWISIDMAQWTFQGNSTWPARQGLGAVVVKDNSGNVSFAWGLFGLALRVCVWLTVGMSLFGDVQDAAAVIMGGLADDAAYNDVWQYLGPTSTGGPGSWTQLTDAADWSPRWAFGYTSNTPHATCPSSAHQTHNYGQPHARTHTPHSVLHSLITSCGCRGGSHQQECRVTFSSATGA